MTQPRFVLRGESARVLGDCVVIKVDSQAGSGRHAEQPLRVELERRIDDFLDVGDAGLVFDPLCHWQRRGQRKIDAWTATLRQVAVEFDDASAFVNANTLAELRGLQR